MKVKSEMQFFLGKLLSALNNKRTTNNFRLPELGTCHPPGIIFIDFLIKILTESYFIFFC